MHTRWRAGHDATFDSFWFQKAGVPSPTSKQLVETACSSSGRVAHLVGLQQVVQGVAAPRSLQHAGLQRRGAHHNVPDLVHNHALPVALVRAEQLAAAWYGVLQQQ